MQIYKDSDGHVWADEFDDEIEITIELIESADPQYLAVSDDWQSLTMLGVPYRLVCKRAHTVVYLRERNDKALHSDPGERC